MLSDISKMLLFLFSFFSHQQSDFVLFWQPIIRNITNAATNKCGGETLFPDMQQSTINVSL